jgi:choline dehydrogenase-like flavoprotein
MGWKILGHPGVWLEHSAEENLAVEPVTKDGEVLSLADAKFSSSDAAREPVGIPGYDPQKGAEPPSGTADVVLVGVGAVGALIAPVLTRAGLRVVGLEAGPYRKRRDFIPEELGSSYYARGAMGQKFLSETPRWRLREGEPTGPAAQMWGLDDFIAAEFDAPAHGFVGGATPNVENQRLPLGVTREALPPDVPTWGQGYKDHVRTWQHWAAVRIQPDTLSYHANFLDLDPRHRDKSGLGLPLVLITYDMQRNEHRLSDWMEGKAQQILHEMGARETWRGPRFGGVMSSHDLGDCRMGEDRQGSVVNPELGVHDTPGLYVFGGAVFPTCHGVNPTLTMWALCYRAAERLIERLHNGEER